MADKQQHHSGHARLVGTEGPRHKLDSGAEGWESYRRWLAEATAPRQRRPGFDNRLYTWHGYRDWMKKVKRDWETEA
jgi:hypothetical protein